MCSTSVTATFFKKITTTTTTKRKYVFWWLSSALSTLCNCFSASEWNLSWKLNSLGLAWVPSLRIHPSSAELFQVGVLDPKQTLWQPPPNSKYSHYSLVWTYCINTTPWWLLDTSLSPASARTGNTPHIVFCGAIESKSEVWTSSRGWELALHSVVGHLLYMPLHDFFFSII